MGKESDYWEKYKDAQATYAQTEFCIEDYCKKIDYDRKASISELSYICELKRRSALEWYRCQIAYHEYLEYCRELERNGVKNV